MNTGGAETFLMKMYRALDLNQYQMDFCVNTDVNFYAEEIAKLGGKIYKVPLKSSHPLLWYRETKKVVSENKYEYVLRISEHSLAALDLWVAKKAGATKLIMRSSNASSESRFTVILHRLFMPLARSIPNVRIAPSLLAAEYTFGKKCVDNRLVTIINNGVDLDVYKYSVEARKKIRHEFCISDSQFVCGHIGRFTQQKNHKYLLNVFKQVCKKNPNSILLIIGSGELRDEISKQIDTLGIRDNVIMTGVRLDIPDLLSAMDIFILPSLYEGMPNTVIEAQATGLRCVVSDSITREANITGMVEYLPLTESVSPWVEAVLATSEIDRFNIGKIIKQAGYSIDDVKDKFISLVLDGRENNE